MHHTILNILRIYSKTQLVNNYSEAYHLMKKAISACVHATQCVVNHTMQHSPGEIVYGRDMFMDIPVIADLKAIRERRQLLIDKNLRRQNRRRYEYHYRVGDYVHVKVYNPRKGEDKLHGPYKIQETRTNGTVVVVRDEEGNVTKTYNTRKLEPYKGPPIIPRTRKLNQTEDKRQYFLAERARGMLAANIVERSIAGGKECNRL